MILDIDIFRSAQVLVKHHGEDALIEDAIRADAMPDRGDLDGSECGGGDFPCFAGGGCGEQRLA